MIFQHVRSVQTVNGHNGFVASLDLVDALAIRMLIHLICLELAICVRQSANTPPYIYIYMCIVSPKLLWNNIFIDNWYNDYT